MKKLFCFASAAVIALGLSSCNKEDALPLDPSQTGRQLTIVASTESSVDTKTSLSGDEMSGYQVIWNEGDKFFLRKRVWNLEFSIKEGVGTAKGTFVETDPSEIEDGTYDIYYATNGNELSNISYYVAGNVISSAPMKGSVTVKDGVASVVELKNLCGLLRLRLKGSGTVKEIKVSADQALAGAMKITDNSAIIYYRGENTVTQDCGDGVNLTDEGADFYIPLPPNEYSGVEIVIKDFQGRTCTKRLKSDKRLNIARAQITPISLNVAGLGENIPGALAGEFTVNADGKKVRFSRGLMYWNGESFELEPSQSYRQTEWDSNHVNHFYWSWLDYVTYAKEYDYGEEPRWFLTNDDLDNTKPSTWLTVNGVKGKYRVLTYFEWQYLLDNHSRRWVTVNDIPGYVIAPDGVELGYSSSYTEEELSAGNLVFLPATGIRRSGDIWDCTSVGYYWTSSASTDDYGCGMYLCRDKVDKEFEFDYAFSVRLVTDID